MKNWFEIFKYDYKKLCGHDYSFFPCILRLLKNDRLRYMFYGRMSCSNNFLWKKIAKRKLYKYYKLYGLDISFNNIGPGLLLLHPHCITINSKTIIKGDLTMFKGSTIGSIRSGTKKGCPTIEKNVVICLNATVVGNIHIGTDVLIDPNSYVNFDVPDHSVVIGNPGVIHKKENATSDYISGV